MSNARKTAVEICLAIQARIENVTSPFVLELVVINELTAGKWPVTPDNIEHLTSAVNGELYDPTPGRDLIEGCFPVLEDL
jgi:hypothetical protein